MCRSYPDFCDPLRMRLASRATLRACVTEELEEAYTTGPIAEAGLSRYTE